LAVRLVLLLTDGPREGENDFLEFPSIEDLDGRCLISYDYLNELCGSPVAQRRYG
jgi:hypothetical protein